MPSKKKFTLTVFEIPLSAGRSYSHLPGGRQGTKGLMANIVVKNVNWHDSQCYLRLVTQSLDSMFQSLTFSKNNFQFFESMADFFLITFGNSKKRHFLENSWNLLYFSHKLDFYLRSQPISVQCCISYRNQSFDLHCKSNNWSQYEEDH